MTSHRNLALIAALSLVFVFGAVHRATAETRQPNVILVMTDDQGYGDLGCHGNPVLKTPNIDRLAADCVRLTNYHVDPTCAPTRAALMTGRYSSRGGVWHTIMGRSILRKDETTMAQVFADGRYKTGIFGKWHLGDNYPYRPQDRGFQEVLIHGGGGVGQTPDHWGNDYFDDTYLHNGKPEKASGYCTDVWFDAALRFIETNKDRPFFAYVATNAPHAPYLVDKKYSEPYRQLGVPSPRAEFYGMIADIDEKIGRLEAALDRLSLKENTVLIFTTDNGSAAGMQNGEGYNAGMRGMKGSEYDGGHRVPFFVRWPAGKLNGGRDVGALTAHIDVLPTLIDLCGLSQPENVKFDGESLVSSLRNPSAKRERTLFVHSQRIEHPEKWRQCSVMTDRWRLVDGKELFDVVVDAGQKRDVAAENPDVVARLRAEYDTWWAGISKRFDEYVRIELGSQNANPVSLTCHDWHAPLKDVPWDQRMVEKSHKGNGVWAVEIVRDGRYEFTLRNRPAETHHRLGAAKARIQIGDVQQELNVPNDAESVSFTADLKAGPAFLQTWLDEPNGTSRGAYYVEVNRVETSPQH